MSQPKLLSKPWATDGLKNDIPTVRGTGLAQEAATYTEGFPSITMTPISVGGKPPSGKDMNGILYEVSAHIVYTNKGQRYCFDQTFCTSIGGYPKGAVLMNDAGTAEYISLIDRNTANFNLPTVNISGKWAIYAGEGAIPAATTTGRGLTQLSSATNSNAEDCAATPKAIKTVLDALTNLDGRSFKQYGALSSRNLNDLKGDANYGVWHQTANAAATAERNYPTTKAGTLYVLPYAYSGQQIYYPLDQNVFYKRHSLPDGSWSVWHTMCEVIDSPSSTSTTAAASANQVKRLNDRAANIERTKLGNTGNQTISNGGLIVGNPTVWFKTTYPSGNGRWVFETDPAGSVNTPNSIRFNYKFEEDGQPVKYLSFPDIGTGQIVAYQSWVNNRIKAVAAENSAAQSAPSGMIAYFARNAAPAGWLKANGAAVSRTTYASLFAAIGTTFGAGDGSTTFNLPDLRGEFVRGWDDGRGIDTGRAFGSAQADAFQGHARNLKRSQSDARMHGLNYYQNVETNNNPHSPAPAAINNGDTWLTHDYLPHLSYGTPRVAAETRPRNIALLACIKI